MHRRRRRRLRRVPPGRAGRQRAAEPLTGRRGAAAADRLEVACEGEGPRATRGATRPLAPCGPWCGRLLETGCRVALCIFYLRIRIFGATSNKTLVYTSVIFITALMLIPSGSLFTTSKLASKAQRLGLGYWELGINSKLLSEAYLRREPRDTENATLTQLRQPRPPCLHATLPPCPCMACTIYVMQICTTFTTHRAHAHARAHAAHAPMRPRRVLSS